MDILKIFNLFKDTVLVDIYSHGLTSFPLPVELSNKSIESYDIIVDNYSTSKLDEIIIRTKFNMKFNPLIYNQDNQRKEYLLEKENIKISNLYPKEKLYIHVYPDIEDENYYEKPIVYIDGNILGLKTKIINIFYNFFKFKILSFITLLIFFVPIYMTYKVSKDSFVLLEKTNTIVTKKELMDQKIFNYYKRMGLNPSLGQYEIIDVPKTFYAQEELKKFIRTKCNERYILEVNNTKDFESLFKQKQIMNCK